MSEKYTCDCCEKTYEKSWSDSEAMAESEQLWGVIPEEEQSIICDDCFKKFYSFAEKEDLILKV